LWSSGTDNSIICSGGIVEDPCDFLYRYKISLLPSVSVLFCSVVCALGEKFVSSAPQPHKRSSMQFWKKKSDYSKLTVLFNLAALFYNFLSACHFLVFSFLCQGQSIKTRSSQTT